MDSINTDGRVEGFLSTMLEGYENNLQSVDQFIEQNQTQLDGAKAQRDEIVEKIAELKDLLGLEDEVETPELEIVKDE
jgi:hypothetical protein